MEKNKWIGWLAEYFSFSVRERWALIILVLLVITVWLLPGYLPVSQPVLILEDSLLGKMSKDLRQTSEKQPDDSSKPLIDDMDIRYSRPFPFDPNTADQDVWMRLGLPSRVAESILRYREKGGRFRKAEDLKKIYGLQAALAIRLLPYVVIAPDKKKGFGSLKRYEHDAGNSSTAIAWKKKISPVAINTADSLEWEALPGIGPALAARILKFRDRLGGFYQIRQVGEVYGLEDSVFMKIEPYLTIDNTAVKQIAVNEATKEEMAAHPYFRWKIAQAIVSFRQQHGPFTELEELKEIHLITEDQFRKMVPYCSIR